MKLPGSPALLQTVPSFGATSTKRSGRRTITARFYDVYVAVRYRYGLSSEFSPYFGAYRSRSRRDNHYRIRDQRTMNPNPATSRLVCGSGLMNVQKCNGRIHG